MEGTGGGRESAREIFEMGAKSGQKIARLHSEGRAKEKRLRVKAEKRVAKFEDKMGGSEECRKLNAREKWKRMWMRRERSTTGGTGMPVKKWKE
jgi:hypothetical protein